jgi:hypothetical protein
MLIELRKEVSEGRIAPWSERAVFRAFAWLLRRPALYRLGARLGRLAQAPLARGGRIRRVPFFFGEWTRTRDLPRSRRGRSRSGGPSSSARRAGDEQGEFFERIRAEVVRGPWRRARNDRAAPGEARRAARRAPPRAVGALAREPRSLRP